MYRNLAYLNFFPDIHKGTLLQKESSIIGRVKIDQGVKIGPYSVLRADGESITISKNVYIGPRSTVHIAHKNMSATISEGSSIGSYSLVHACYIGKNVIIGDLSAVMDGSRVGEGAVITAGSLVPPGKKVPPYTLMGGSPAKKLRKINRDEVAKLHYELRNKEYSFSSLVLQSLSKDNFSIVPFSHMKSIVNRPRGYREISDAAYVAPGAIMNGNVSIGDFSSLWFSCFLSSNTNGKITVGMGSNIQDNTFIDAKESTVLIGDRVTIGHNVRLGVSKIGDDCLLGMGSVIDDEVMIESGGVVAARSHVTSGTRIRPGEIFAGRPAKFFRNVTTKEKELFSLGQKIYEKYVLDYTEK